jgi:hypothetical protein
MKALWTLLFWGITISLATAQLISLHETHPVATNWLTVLALFAFCAALSLGSKK